MEFELRIKEAQLREAALAAKVGTVYVYVTLEIITHSTVVKSLSKALLAVISGQNAEIILSINIQSKAMLSLEILISCWFYFTAVNTAVIELFRSSQQCKGRI